MALRTAHFPVVLERRRAFQEELRQVESALDAARALDRVAGRMRNPRVAAVLRERAEARRRMARWARDHLGGRVPCPDPAFATTARISHL